MLHELAHLMKLGGVPFALIVLYGVVCWTLIVAWVLQALYRKAWHRTERSISLGHLWLLRCIAVIAPLTGLMGTVGGIMHSFRDLSVGGRHLAEGIAEALICTAAGLAVAIPAAVAYAFLLQYASRVEEAR